MKKILFFISLAIVSMLAGCESTKPTEEPASQISLDNNIGDLARIVESPSVAVRGFGIVAGLFGTGSAECPPALREALEKYIRQQLPEGGINPRRFIESLDTAVVEVLGIIPPMASAGQSFDVMVRPLSSTQTTSLAGGQLYTTDLKEMSRFTGFNQYTRTVARAQGPIFADRKADGTSSWYILGGGYPLSDTNISFLLNQPDFVAASAIRNRLNERFGANTAQALSASEILLFIPPKYHYDKPRFIQMVLQLYLADQPALRDRRIALLASQLQSEPDKLPAELALEAVGKAALDALAPLLKSEDAAVQFHAARCMSNIGDARPFPVLREIAQNPDSPFRGQALTTIGRNVRLNDAEPILLQALGQADMQFRLLAYQIALDAQSSLVSRTLVANNFFVDSVACDGPKVIYAFRQVRPGIIIFGSPVRCSDNIFMRSEDGEVTLNARPGDKFISVSRTHPNRPRVIGPIASGFEISQLVRALGQPPEQKQGTSTLPGLSLPYSQIIDILGKMCTAELIPAGCQQGPVTNVETIFENM